MKIKQLLALYSIIAGIVLGVSFNLLFIWQVPGISALIYTLLAIVIFKGGLVIKENSLRWTAAEALYLPILLLAAIPLLSQNYILSTLSILGVGILGLYTAILRGWEIKLGEFNLIDIFVLPLFQQAILIGYVFHPFVQLLDTNAVDKSIDKASKTAGKILIGIGIALPILCCFLILFLISDQAISRLIATSLNWDELFSFERLWELFVMALVSMWWVGSLSALYTFKLDGAFVGKLTFTKRLDAVIANVIIWMTNILFACFSVIQIFYLFAGRDRVAELNLTYAEYARQGFIELVVAGVFSLSLIYVLGRYLKGGNATIILAKVGLLLQGIGTLVILASAFTRLSLYTQGYGLTDTRLFVVAFMVVLAIMVAALLLGLVIKPILDNLQLIFVVVCCLVLYGLAVLNPDRFVANTNINNFQQQLTEHKSLDYRYIVNLLSSDGYSQLLDVPAFVQEEGWKCKLAYRWVDEKAHRSKFGEFNIGHAAVRESLDQKLSELIDKNGKVVPTCKPYINLGR